MIKPQHPLEVHDVRKLRSLIAQNESFLFEIHHQRRRFRTLVPSSKTTFVRTVNQPCGFESVEGAE